MNITSNAVNTGTENSDFSARFSYLRKISGLSQREIADKLGISNRAVSKWETGRSTPKFIYIPALASIFGVTTDYLFGCDRK